MGSSISGGAAIESVKANLTSRSGGGGPAGALTGFAPREPQVGGDTCADSSGLDDMGNPVTDSECRCDRPIRVRQPEKKPTRLDPYPGVRVAAKPVSADYASPRHQGHFRGEFHPGSCPADPSRERRSVLRIRFDPRRLLAPDEPERHRRCESTGRLLAREPATPDFGGSSGDGDEPGRA